MSGGRMSGELDGATATEEDVLRLALPTTTNTTAAATRPEEGAS